MPTTTRKRKKSEKTEESDPTPSPERLSKKQKLQLDRERAKKYAETTFKEAIHQGTAVEEEYVVTQAKETSPTKRARNTARRKPAAAAAATTTTTTSEKLKEEQSKPVKRAARKSTSSSTRTPRSKAKTPSRSKISPKKAALLESRQRAQKYADENFLAESKKTEIVSSYPLELTSVPTVSSEQTEEEREKKQEKVAKVDSPLKEGTQPHTAFKQEAMVQADSLVKQAHQSLASPIVMDAGGRPCSAFAAAKSPQSSTPQSFSTPQQYIMPPPQISGPATKKTQLSDTNEEASLAEEAQAQAIHEQVMANAHDVIRRASVENVNVKKEEEVFYDVEETLSVGARVSRALMTVLRCMGLLVVFAFGTSMFYVVMSSTSGLWAPAIPNNATSESVKETVPKLCFLDTPNFSVEEQMDRLPCQGIKQDCPKFGRCFAGALRDCGESGVLVPYKNTSCIMSTLANETYGKVESTLGTMTTNELCKLSSFIFTSGDKERQHWFDTHTVLGKANVSIDLFAKIMPHADRHNVMQLKDKLALSLEYIHSKLPVPFWCWVTSLLIGLSIGVVGFIYQVTFGMGSKLVWDYPIPTTIVFGTIYLLSCWHRSRKRKAKLRSDIRLVRSMLYEKLQETPDKPIALIMLRDEIAHDLFPDSQRSRKTMFKDVWPRVVGHVRGDNRIYKVTQIVRGEPLEHWQWIMVSSVRKEKNSLPPH